MKSQYFRTLSYIRPYSLTLFFTFIIVLLFATSNVFFIPLVRDIGNEISRKHSVYFSFQMLNAILLWSVRVFAQFGQTYLMSKISYKIMIDIQQDIYNKLHYSSQHFFSNWKLGELIVRMFNDSVKVKEAILKTFSNLIPQAITLIGVVIYLFTLEWKLTCFALVSVPIFVGVINYFGKIIQRRASQIQKKVSNITHIVQESTINMKLIQAYTMEPHSKAKLKRQNKKNFVYQLSMVRLHETKKIIELLLQGLVFISIIFIGGHLVAQNNLTGPELISFFTGCILLIDPILAFSSGFAYIQESKISATRIYEILDYESEIQESTNAIQHDIEGKVEFKNVSFVYKGSTKKVLDNISIEANHGEVVALVGLSGAGKSTLTNLIPRFYDASEGEILIDSIPVQDYSLNSLRSQIGMVLQDDILFSGTILENIKFGSPNASTEAVIEAAKLANAWDFIKEYKDKLYTHVGDQGRRLSGGQKQRISIARAILRNPKILILDEATSALDSESEQLVKEALVKLMKNRTTFVIAHRLSTIQHANKIAVLDKGKIIEIGKHDDLLKSEGKYSKLYAAQFR